MATSNDFEGLLDHNVDHLGEFQYVEPATAQGGNRGYDLVFYTKTEYEVTSVVTNGLRFQDVTALLPEELICTLHSGQEGIARHIVDVTAGLVIANGRGIEYDSILTNSNPLVAGTNISGIIGYPSPYFGPDFDLFRDSTGRAVLQTITLIPVTREEAEFAGDNSVDELWDIWREKKANILDINRLSAL
ncbi:suppressor of fused domain protein [Nocardia sp. NPDC058058]|uniref:suppressor of fused domain protein n=1 Tax=Nocardia sp. NPDC058058 TaxID=3346317 RepID=UPI0036DBA320